MRSAPDYVGQNTDNLPVNVDQNVNFNQLFQNDIYAVLNQANFPSVSDEDYRIDIQEAYKNFKTKWFNKEKLQGKTPNVINGSMGKNLAASYIAATDFKSFSLSTRFGVD